MIEEENCNSQATEEWLNQEEVISGVQWSKVDLVGLYFIFWNDFNTDSTEIPRLFQSSSNSLLRCSLIFSDVLRRSQSTFSYQVRDVAGPTFLMVRAKDG